MRNLKKFLALVLAMMMVMGLMVTANAATDYVDDDKIANDYREAVEIMSAVNVIKGDENGFRPKDTITRAEFAKLLYVIDTGDTELLYSDSWTGLANFSDVPENEWYAGVVAYAQIRGYVWGDAGVGGPFRPEENIIGYEVLTALDRLLGQTIAGDNWELNAAVTARDLGITDGVSGGSYYRPAATRELTAKLVFNSMFYTSENGYTYTVYIDATGGNINVYDADIDTLLYQGPNYEQAMLYAQSQGALVESVKNTAGSLADLNFNGLRKLENIVGRDDFQRPTTLWVDNDYIAADNAPIVAEFAHTPIKTYDGNFTGKDAKALVGAAKLQGANPHIALQGAVNAGDIDVYYNGGNADTYTDITFRKAAQGTNGMWIDDDNGQPGLEVEIYTHTATSAVDKVKYDVIVREAYVAKINDITSTGVVKVDIFEYSTSNNHGQPNDTFTTPNQLWANPATATSEADDHYDEVAAFKKNAYFAIYVKPGWDTSANFNSYHNGAPTGGTKPFKVDADAIAGVAELSITETTIRQINDNGANVLSSIITLTGTEYKINNEAMLLVGTNTKVVTTFRWGTLTRNFDIGPANLYTLNGKIMIIDLSTTTTTTSGYAYLYDYLDPDLSGSLNWESQGGNTSGTYTGKAYVRMLTTDGTTLEVRLNKNCVDDSKGGNATGGNIIDKADLGNLVYYRYDGAAADTYTVTRVDATVGSLFNATTQRGLKAGTGNELKITNSKSEGVIPGFYNATNSSIVDGNGGTPINVAFTGATKFIVVTTNLTNMSKPNYMVTGKVYNIYDVPDITANSNTTFVTAAKALSGGNSGGLVDYADPTKTEIASVVLVVDAQTTVTANGYYFALGDANATKVRVMRSNDVTDYYEYIVYKAVVDGKLGTVKVKVYDSDEDSITNALLAANALLGNASDNKIKFIKDPIMDEYGCIIDWGTDVAYTAQTAAEASTGNPVDGSVIYAGTAVTAFKDDHIKISDTNLNNGQEDYLVSAALSVAFKYNWATGVLEQIAVEDIKATTSTGTANADWTWTYAVRNSQHTVVNMLFIMDPNATP